MASKDGERTMSVGIIKFTVEMRLECDIEDAEAKDIVEGMEKHFETSTRGCGVESIEVKDECNYDGVPSACLNHPDHNGQ